MLIDVSSSQNEVEGKTTGKKNQKKKNHAFYPPVGDDKVGAACATAPNGELGGERVLDLLHGITHAVNLAVADELEVLVHEVQTGAAHSLAIGAALGADLYVVSDRTASGR
jgi:hypothetical protein